MLEICGSMVEPVPHKRMDVYVSQAIHSRVCKADGAGRHLRVCIEPPVHGVTGVGQECADGVTSHLVAVGGNRVYASVGVNK
jgi:hypothetical protein